MHLAHRKTCRACGSPHLIPVIDLGLQYLQGSFIKPGVAAPPQHRLPTQLVRCDVTANGDACGLLQMAHTVPPEILYSNYWYRSGTNATMRNHLRSIVEEVLALTGDGRRRVLDIGCNDGTLLSFYPESFERFGVDPSDIAREIKPPVIVVGASFPSDLVFSAFGDRKFDVVTSIAMFYDQEAPVDFATATKRVLTEDGIWVMEMSYLPMMLDMNAFDTICHEHLEYYSLAAIEYIAAKAGLSVFRAQLNDINGGSIRCWLTHAGSRKFETPEDQAFLRKLRLDEAGMELGTDKPYLAFQERIAALRAEMITLLKKIRAKGKRIHVYGASTKGNVLLQWYGIDKTLIECAADRNPDKAGARTIGTSIAIVDEATSRAMKPDYYLVLPWHFKAEFLAREREIIKVGTKMIFPLPQISIIDAGNLDAVLAGLTPPR